MIIRPRRGWLAFDLRELWSFRDLLLILAIRDVKLRYKQTALGIVWVILQPLVTAIIFAVVFGGFAKLPSDGRPYILFVFAGLLPWNLFAAALQRSGSSLVENSNLVTKVYFPRTILPLACTGAVLVDFAVSLAVMVPLMLYYEVDLTWQVTALPLFLLMALLTSVGVGLWLSGLNVFYRDFMYTLPFLIQAWTYASPIAYSMTIVPEQWRWLFSLNPAVGFVEGFRWSLLGSSGLTFEMVLFSSLSAVILFTSGALLFGRIERGFADAI